MAPHLSWRDPTLGQLDEGPLSGATKTSFTSMDFEPAGRWSSCAVMVTSEVVLATKPPLDRSGRRLEMSPPPVAVK